MTILRGQLFVLTKERGLPDQDRPIRFSVFRVVVFVISDRGSDFC